MHELETIKDYINSNKYSSRFRTTCPWCSPNRQKSNDRVLSISIEDGHALYYCHHCSEKGKIKLDIDSTQNRKQNNPVNIKQYDTSLQDDAINWLKRRGITNLDNIVSGTRWFRDLGRNGRAVGFKYYNDDKELSAIKWRSIESKDYTQEGSLHSLYLIDEFEEGDIVITEGELDALAFREAGYCAVSIPNGSPGPGKQLVNDSFLWTYRDALQKKSKRVLIAMDNDEAGYTLADDLSRRIGKYKCWKVIFPKGIKDGNDMLVEHGVDGLHKVIEDSQPWPIDGIHSPKEYSNSVIRLHVSGFPKGPSTGIASVDELYNLAPSTLTLLTGVPGTGKSTWLNWLMASLALKHDYKFALWSAEMPPEIIISNLCQLYQDKPFRGSGGMDGEELEEALDWVNRHFVIIETQDNTIDSIVEAAKASVLRYGVHGLIADPYNFINVPSEVRDENGLGKVKTILTKLKSLSMECGIHTVLVAHPRKMGKDMDGETIVPTGYDVSGSADFYNVPDIGITISSDKDKNPCITNWKTRFPHLGKTGNCRLSYNKTTGAFGEYGSAPAMYFQRGQDPWMN